MNSKKLILLLFVFLCSVSFVSAASHGVYPSFSAAEQGFVVDNHSLSVVDDAVYKTGWYSIAGADWQSFSLSGSPYGASTDWLSGASVASLPDFGVGEHYVIIYSCSNPNNWDCHGNNAYPDGFWQLQVINISTDGGSVENYLRTFYVSNSLGNDSWSGKAPTWNGTDGPWKTIMKVNSETFKPGDGILFKRGDTWREELDVPSSGNATDYITFGAYGTGNKPKILGSEQVTAWTNQGGNIWVSDNTFYDPFGLTEPYGGGPNYRSEIFFVQDDGTVNWGNTKKTSIGDLGVEFDWTWSDNHIYIYSSTNPTTKYNAVEIPQRARAIFIDAYENIEIDGFELQFASARTIQTEYPQQATSGLTIKNCDISYVGSRFLELGYHLAVFRSNMLIQNNNIHDGGRRDTSFHVYGTTGLSFSNITIENNNLHNGYHSSGVGIISNEDNTLIENIIIRNNLIWDPPTRNISADGFGTNEMCSICDETAGANSIVRNIQIYNNIFMYVDETGVWLDGVDNASVYQNTFYDFNPYLSSEYQAVQVKVGGYAYSTDISIKNNIFYGTGNRSINGGLNNLFISYSQNASEVSIDYNLFYQKDKMMYVLLNHNTGYRTADGTKNMIPDIYNDYGWQAHSPTNYLVAPKFVSAGINPDVHLATDSPAIDAGVIIPSFHCATKGAHPNEDCVEWYGSAPDIGAFEYQSGPKTYYVSNSLGNDSYNGTDEQHPWKTLEYAEEHATTPGDLIALKRGDVWAIDNVFEITHSGNATHDIVWDGDLWGSGEKAIIQVNIGGGEKPIYYSTIRFVGCHDVVFQNIIVDGDNKNRYGVVIGGSNAWDGTSYQNNEHNIIIQGCEIKNFGDGTSYQIGLLVRPHRTDIWNITIRNNSIHGTGAHNIALYPTRNQWLPEGVTQKSIKNVYIGYNKLYEFRRYMGNVGLALIITGDIDNVVVEHNFMEDTLAHSSCLAFEGHPNDGDYYPDNITIRYNFINATRLNGIVTYQGGPIHAKIYGNTIVNTGYESTARAIDLNSGYDYSGAHFDIFQNTMYITGIARGFFDGTSIPGTVNFNNNIIYNTGTNYCSQAMTSNSTIHNNNLYYMTQANLNYVHDGNYYNAAELINWESTAVVADPLFVDAANNNFTLQSASPAIDAGVRIPGIHCASAGAHPNEDCVEWYGKAPDIGAFESSYTAGPSPDYYVANDGNDGNLGTSAASAWQTIDKVNQADLQPGDTIAFKRGDEWHETLDITHSGTSGEPITFTAYGEGNKPVISGFTTLTSWTAQGNGVYSAHCPECAEDLNLVTIDNENIPMGRWPNTGEWMYPESIDAQSTLIDNELPSTPDWDGAELVLRKSDWTIENNRITSHSGNTIHYDAYSTFWAPNSGYGYFIQDHPDTLDVFGEWYYDGNDLYVYFGSENPTMHVVKASTQEVVIDIDMLRSYITFDNLLLEGANNHSIYSYYNNHISIQNCDIQFSGKNAISAWLNAYMVVENTTINHTNNIAILTTWYGSQGQGHDVLIKNNRIENTGLIPGMCDSNDFGCDGIAIAIPNATVEYNEIKNTGHIPLRFDYENALIKNNYIDNYALTKNDAGGIYSWSATSAKDTLNRKIIDNIVVNGIGTTAGMPYETTAIEGIYMDSNVDHVEIAHNTVVNVTGYGIFFQNSNKTQIFDNKVYNSGVAGIYLRTRDAGKEVSGMDIHDNLIVSTTPDQYDYAFTTFHDNINDFGTSDYNHYVRPLGEDRTFRLVLNNDWSGIEWTLDEWRANTGKDIHSKQTMIDIPPYTLNGLIGENHLSYGSFDTNIGTTGCYVNIGDGANGCSPSWSDTGELDDGALQISYAPDSSTGVTVVAITINPVINGKQYLLRFSAVGTTDTDFDVYLRQRYSPRLSLTEIKHDTIRTSRKEYEFLFPVDTDLTGDHAIVFNIEQNDGNIWFDNVELYEADVTLQNYDEHFLLEYNPTREDKTIALQGVYTDVDGNSVSGSVTLQPYTSIALVRT